LLQQTGHATDGISCFSGLSRVSRLLSVVVREHEGTRPAMSREGDSFVFQRLTAALRKPIVRFRLPSGRRVELLGFHLEPGWAFGGESPRPIAHEVARRLYPDEQPVFVGDPEQTAGPAWLCVAYLYSDTPARPGGTALDCSVLLACGLVSDIGVGVRAMVGELLSRIEWEAVAADDMMW
jgi:hypothetical protein